MAAGLERVEVDSHRFPLRAQLVILCGRYRFCLSFAAPFPAGVETRFFFPSRLGFNLKTNPFFLGLLLAFYFVRDFSYDRAFRQLASALDR